MIRAPIGVDVQRFRRVGSGAVAVRALHELASPMAETTSTPETPNPLPPPQGEPQHQDLAALSAGVAIDALDDEELDDDDRITQRMPSQRDDPPEP